MSERFTKKVGDSSLIFVKPADLSRAGYTGVVAQGEFVEALPNKFDESKNDFKFVSEIEYEINGMDSNGKSYTTTINEGDTLIINAAGNLNYYMKQISPGNLCQILYKGKNEIEKGERKGMLAHNFDVFAE